MKCKWIITAHDEKSYRDFVSRYRGHNLVKARIARNVQHVDVAISKPRFWKALVGCLVTTQQRSGEGSHVSAFLNSGDVLLDIEHCLKLGNISGVAEKTLKSHGLRRTTNIAEEMNLALAELSPVRWREVHTQLSSIASHTNARRERAVAKYMKDTFKGIGPKQSRNLIQEMGLSKYEIPLDSRIVKVLNSLNFPVPLSSKALADENYYCFIEDGIHLLLKRLDIYPCVFDACAFASLETGLPPEAKP
jgi:hypothetical protein